MVMIRFFDYLYYRIFHFYKVKWKEGNPEIYATSLLTLLQSFFMAFIPMSIFELVTSVKLISQRKYIVAVLVVLFLFNVIRYNRLVTYESLAVRFDSEEKAVQKKNGVYISLFIILCCVVSVALAIILGEIGKGGAL